MGNNNGYQFFDFFDQFDDVSIDLSSYSSKFLNTTTDNINFSNIQPVTVTLKNIFEHINIINDYKKDASFFESYKLKETDKIQNLSFNIYNTKDYWWIIYVFNNIRNPYFDLPLTESQIVKLAKKLVIKENLYTEFGYYNLLSEANEKKRDIILPKQFIINTIVTDYRKVLSPTL